MTSIALKFPDDADYYQQVRDPDGTVTLVPLPDFVPDDPDFAKAIAYTQAEDERERHERQRHAVAELSRQCQEKARLLERRRELEIWEKRLARTPEQVAADDAAERAEYEKFHKNWVAVRPVQLGFALAELEDIPPEHHTRFQIWYHKYSRWFRLDVHQLSIAQKPRDGAADAPNAGGARMGSSNQPRIEAREGVRTRGR